MNKLRVTVCGKNIDELKANLKQLLDTMTVGDTRVTVMTTPETAQAPAKKKAGRPKKAIQEDYVGKEDATETSPEKDEVYSKSPAQAVMEEAEEKSPIDISKMREEAQAKAAQPVPAAPAVSYNFADTKAALKELIEIGDRGVAAGQEILKSYGIQRISQLKEEHYTAFIEKCKEAMKKTVAA